MVLRSARRLENPEPTQAPGLCCNLVQTEHSAEENRNGDTIMNSRLFSVVLVSCRRNSRDSLPCSSRTGAARVPFQLPRLPLVLGDALLPMNQCPPREKPV